MVRASAPDVDSGLRWPGIDVLAYKPVGTHFQDITRQVLFTGEQAAGVEVRYFEIAPGGHSTLERHAHVHAVIVVHGRGRVLVADAITPIAPFSLVHVPPFTWHQFRADEDAPLGFLCLVACERDRPVRPTPDDLAALTAHPEVAAFIRT